MKNKYLIMSSGGFPSIKNEIAELCDWPNELIDSDFFQTIDDAKSRIKTLRTFRYFKYEDFQIMEIHNFNAIMRKDLSALTCIACR